MKLAATITRRESRYGKSVTFTFQNGRQYHRQMESIVERAIGPRPWAEMSMWKDGKAIRGFAK